MLLSIITNISGESTVMSKDNGKTSKFNGVITLNKLNSIPEQKKTHIQIMFEEALRNKKAEEKTTN